MCGFVGSYAPQQPGKICNDETLIAMRNRMIHRGPDGGDIWRDPHERCALGHRRLSIIDLSSQAKQPMSNSDGSIVMVFNGEIYNYIELRETLKAEGYEFKTSSDSEVQTRSTTQTSTISSYGCWAT